MKYTSKDLLAAAGIGRDTLRYLEKAGIIQPEISSENGYHYYDVKALGILLECRRRQASGFSVKEIAEQFRTGSFDTMLEELKSKQKKRAEELFEQMRTYDYMQDRIDQLTSISKELNVLKITTCPYWCFTASGDNDSYMLDPEHVEALQFMNAHKPYVSLASYVADLHSRRFAFGHSIRMDLATELGGDPEKMIQIPGEYCVYGIVKMVETWSFSNAIQTMVLDFAEKQGVELRGDMLNNQLAAMNEQDHFCRYVEVIAPLKEKEDHERSSEE